MWAVTGSSSGTGLLDCCSAPAMQARLPRPCFARCKVPSSRQRCVSRHAGSSKPSAAGQQASGVTPPCMEDCSTAGIADSLIDVHESDMKISIFGLGYVGAVSLACLARDGHSVIGVDIDEAKLALIRAGKTPVVEEGMVDLMACVASSGRVTVTTDVLHAVRETQLSLICVGTPSAPNGSQDLSATLKVARELGRA